MRMRFNRPPFMRRAVHPPSQKVIEERIKARANWAQTVGLAVFGLSVLTPIFNVNVKVPLALWVVGGFASGLLLVVNQVILGYLPDPNAREAKEQTDVD